MKYIYMTFLLISILAMPLRAHENWIDFQVKGDSTDIYICNGHDFPQSQLALKDRIINYCYVIGPSGKKKQVKTAMSGLQRKGRIHTAKPGTYLIVAGLKNPPRYFLKAVITRGKAGTKNKPLGNGELLEIIPRVSPSSAAMNTYVPLLLLFKSRPVTGTLSISINNKIHYYGYTNESGIYKLKIKKRGKYLLTATYSGRSCSLVFHVH